MREIKFRGMRTDNNKFVYGFFEDNGYQKIIHVKDEPFKRSHYVIGKTVTQYTGLDDKYKKNIYSGDIVKGEKYICVIKTIKGGFTAIEISEYNKQLSKYFNDLTDNQMWGWCSSCEVIGNIFENPELLTN